MNNSDDEPDSGSRFKVTRLIDTYDLDGYGAELERRWTGDSGGRSSLRELADDFNQRIVERALASADRTVLEGESANIYRLLTDDVSDAERTRVRRQLERDGVDVDQLQNHLVTYQAIRSYLKEHRNAEYNPEEQNPAGTALEQVDRLQGRLERVTRDKVKQLRDGGTVSVGSFSILTDVTVFCEDCGANLELHDLVEQGDCNCHSRTE